MISWQAGSVTPGTCSRMISAIGNERQISLLGRRSWPAASSFRRRITARTQASSAVSQPVHTSGRIQFVSERTNELLTQLVALQSRQIAVQEAALENQQVQMERQRRVLRRTIPLLVGLIVLLSYGPYLFQWIRYFSQR